MSETPVDPQTEQQQVVEWRWQRMCAAGYPTLAALELAERSTVDLYEALALVAVGCAPLVAIDILL
jgi:hypothetical protein